MVLVFKKPLMVLKNRGIFFFFFQFGYDFCSLGNNFQSIGGSNLSSQNIRQQTSQFYKSYLEEKRANVKLLPNL